MKENNTQPKYEALSSIDTLLKTLTRERDGVKPPSREWKDAFLQGLAMAPIVSVAAAFSGVSRKQAIQERNADAGFARRWDDAMEQGADEIEAAAYFSAVHGQKKPVFHQGLQIGWTVDYSHAMQSMLLKAWRPQVFGKKEKKQAKSEKRPCMTLGEFWERLEEVKRP